MVRPGLHEGIMFQREEESISLKGNHNSFLLVACLGSTSFQSFSNCKIDVWCFWSPCFQYSLPTRRQKFAYVLDVNIEPKEPSPICTTSHVILRLRTYVLGHI